MSDNNKNITQNECTNRPVVISQQEVAKSNAIKSGKPRTFRQLQVVRDASNLAFVVAQIEISCPRKFRCLVDELERLVTELVQVLDLCNENINCRYEMCNEAHSCVMALSIKLEILCRLNGTNRDMVKKTKSLIDSLLRQIIGWRNSSIGQGSVSN